MGLLDWLTDSVGSDMWGGSPPMPPAQGLDSDVQKVPVRDISRAEFDAMGQACGRHEGKAGRMPHGPHAPGPMPPQQ